MRIAILGAGAWGSALAISLGARHDVSLWTRRPEDCERLERERASAYLPQCPLPAAIRIERDIAAAMGRCELAIIATATAGLRPVAEGIARSGKVAKLLWACKGFEEST